MKASSESGECASLISCTCVVACRAGMRATPSREAQLGLPKDLTSRPGISRLGLMRAAQRPGIPPPPLLLILAAGSLAKEGGLTLDRSEDRVRASERLAHLRQCSNCTLDGPHGLVYREEAVR